jgi:Putative collagen-binding domain of a collagenase
MSCTTEPLLGFENLTGISLQSSPFQSVSETIRYVNASAFYGHKWIVTFNEQTPDADPDHDVIRKDFLWTNIMNGGAGIEYYFGYAYHNSDLTCQDFRSRANMWRMSNYALTYITNNNIPFFTMTSGNHLIKNFPFNFVRMSPTMNDIVIYLKNGGTETIDLSRVPSSWTYNVQWFDPLAGGALVPGSIRQVQGGANRTIGNAPKIVHNKDWVVRLKTM